MGICAHKQPLFLKIISPKHDGIDKSEFVISCVNLLNDVCCYIIADNGKSDLIDDPLAPTRSSW